MILIHSEHKANGIFVVKPRLRMAGAGLRPRANSIDCFFSLLTTNPHQRVFFQVSSASANVQPASGLDLYFSFIRGLHPRLFISSHFVAKIQ